MIRKRTRSLVLALGAVVLIAPGPAWSRRAQDAPPPGPEAGPPEAPPRAPQELDDLVAPIALYADPLIAQILAASTYPLEVVEASRLVESNATLTGVDLTDAAKAQPWDPSVQALVAFPSVLAMMDRNLPWTTDLGNAFLSQQQDVMDAIQRQRQRAYSSGKLVSNAQETVETADDAIEIEPAEPDDIYVPVYDPVVVWGSWSYHPWGAFWFPPRVGGALVAGPYGFFLRVSIAHSFRSWGGWSGWGWNCGWRNRGLVVNNNFYIHYNYRPPQNVIRNGPAVWVHDPQHRGGVAYPSARVAARVGGAPARPIAPRVAEPRIQSPPPRPATPHPPSGAAFAGSNQSGSRVRVESDRGHASLATHSAPAPHVSAPSHGRPHK